MFDKNTHILCVDDTNTVQQILKRFLSELGFEHLYFASSADEAAKVINDTETINLVICDVNMPEKSGIDLLKSIREHENYKELPFVLLTMENDLKTVNQAIALGVTGYLLKPFNRDTLEKGLKHAYEKLKKAEKASV